MTHVDEAIRRALSPEDAKTFDALGQDQSILEQAIDAFRGQDILFRVVAWTAAIALFVASCGLVWQFVHATQTREMLLWGAASALTLSGLGMVKLWFWAEMQKNSILRELKRLEFQVASLASVRGA